MTTSESHTPLPTPADNDSRSTAQPAPLRFSPEKIEEMRAEVRRCLARKRRSRRTVVPHPPPRYDEVFVRGTAWLNGEDDPLP